MSNTLQILTAFGAGILSFFAPCVFPLIPAYILFITGLSAEELTLAKEISAHKKKLILTEVVLFILGFSLVFVALGAGASLLGAHFIAYKKIIRTIGGIILVLLGLHLIGLLKLKFLQYQRRIHLKAKPLSWLGSLFVGMAFGFGWTPCVGPILGGILMLAATRDTLIKGVSLLSSYSLGLALPFLLVGMGVKRMFALFTKIEKHLRLITIISGILLIIIGITILIPTGFAATAPDFTLPTLDGERLQLSNFKGKIIILNFWALHCPACQSQIADLLKLSGEYKDDLEIIGIILDKSSADTLTKFIQRKKINYSIVRGNEKVVEDYGGIAFIPTTFIIDQEMNIVKKFFGYKSVDDFKSEIKELLNK